MPVYNYNLSCHQLFVTGSFSGFSSVFKVFVKFNRSLVFSVVADTITMASAVKVSHIGSS